MNKPVEFSIAKLLKEKKQNIFSTSLKYASNGKLTDAIYDFDDWCFAPTIAEVVMWLYEKHGIWVNVYQHKDHAADVNDEYVFRTSYTKLREFNSPTEAYEAAIEYTLNHLI